MTEALVSFSTGLQLESVPRPIISKAKLSILDALGTALLSTRLDKSRRIAKAVRSVSPGGASTVWGYGFRASPLSAALVNGTLVEALDYSDIHVAGGLHPTCVILPAVVSYGETLRAGGKELLLSYILGAEAMIRLGFAASGRFHERGFQPTSIAGVIGAALATSKLAGLSRRQTVDGVSLASTLAFGSSLSVRVGAYFGGIDTGRAAESGILSTVLAGEGVEGIAYDSIEGRFGFLEAHAGPGNYDAARVTARLGRSWMIKDIFLKRYPTSYACTQLLDASMRLSSRVKPKLKSIRRVRFGERAANLTLFSQPEPVKRRPASIYDAKTSHYFLLALALTDGKVTAEGLERYRDRSILKLADRVEPVVDEESRWVEVEFTDGTAIRESQDALIQTPEAQIRKKYLDNASPVIGGRAAAELEEAVDSIESQKDAYGIVRILASGKQT